MKIKDNGAIREQNRKKKRHYASLRRKGFAQTDYVVAIGIFILIFALVVQYVSNYFSTLGDTTSIRVMNSQATSLLDFAERGFEPGHWPQTQANSSVVLLLHLDISTLDSSSYGNNGTISGANCSAAVIGKLDTACSFDGIDDYIDVGGSDNIDSITGDLTLAAWINKRETLTDSEVISTRQGLNDFTRPYTLGVFGATASFRMGNGTAQFGAQSDITSDAFHFIAGTIEGNDMKFYVDGVQTASDTFTGTRQTGTKVIIGAASTTGTRNFNGTIDEVIIYNRSLNESEVYNLWAYENLLDRVGLSTRAYRFFVVVNNSAPYWKNQSLPVETINNELVKINFTELGYGANIPSVAVYEANGSSVGYEINSNTITFRTAVNANSAKNFTVYFDDDSNFAEQTQSITGVNNISEVIEPVQAIYIIQNRKMSALSNSNYTRVKNSTGMPRDFGIRMNDADASYSVLSFGPPVPPSGNIVSFRRYALYQNATGAVRKARITIQVW